MSDPKLAVVGLKTTKEQLITVQAAILAIEAGEQSYSIDSASFSKASLPALYDREERLLKRFYAENSMVPKVSTARLRPEWNT